MSALFISYQTALFYDNENVKRKRKVTDSVTVSKSCSVFSEFKVGLLQCLSTRHTLSATISIIYYYFKHYQSYSNYSVSPAFSSLYMAKCVFKFDSLGIKMILP